MIYFLRTTQQKLSCWQNFSAMSCQKSNNNDWVMKSYVIYVQLVYFFSVRRCIQCKQIMHSSMHHRVWYRPRQLRSEVMYLRNCSELIFFSVGLRLESTMSVPLKAEPYAKPHIFRSLLRLISCRRSRHARNKNIEPTCQTSQDWINDIKQFTAGKLQSWTWND